jgi:tyrosine-protein kinase Etk/Wzc
LSENNMPSGQPPVPYSLEHQVVPSEGYYYPDYPMGQQAAADSDWERIARLLWYRKWWILVVMLLGTGLGWGVTRLIAPSYETFTTVWLQSDGGGRNAQAASALRPGELLQGEGWADVFRSRAVLLPVVEDLRLQLRLLEPDDLDDSIFASFRPGRELRPGVYTFTSRDDGTWSLALDGEGTVQTGRAGQAIGGPVGFEWFLPPAALETGATDIRFFASTIQQAVFELSQGLTVQYNQNSSIIRATLTWGDSEEAANILNVLAEQFIVIATDLKAQKIREEVDMLLEQTEFTQGRLEAAEFALENQRVESITLPSEPSIQVIAGGTPGTPGQPASMYTVFTQRKIQADQLTYDLEQIRDIQSQIGGGSETNLLSIRMIPSASTSPELTGAMSLLQQREIDRQTLLYTYTEDYPDVALIGAEIDDLKQRIIPLSLGLLATQIERQLDLLNEQIDTQSTELRQIPSRMINDARLQREVDHAATLHNTLLLRLKSAQLAEATSGPGIQVLDRAWPAQFPLGDKPGRIIALCSIAGLGLAVVGVIMFDRLDKRIRYPDQITGSLGLPVLGVVPRLQAAPDPSSPTATIAVESFRGLRTQIAHVDGKVEGVTLVTSPAPREGKSMVSANLAISYATAGYKTLLLDGDTRRGRAQEMFDLERSPGLTDYLMGRVDLDEAQQTTSVPNLTLIARGAPGGFNADLLESERMDTLLEQMRLRHEVIVVDGPPLAAGADALILGERSNKVVVVLRAGATKEDLARAKLATMGNVQLPIVGAVLNAMPKSAPYYDYYVHYYYAEAEVAS